MTDFRQPHIAGRIEGYGFDADTITQITSLLAKIEGILPDTICVTTVSTGNIPGCGIVGNVEPGKFVADEAENTLRTTGNFSDTLIFQVNPS